MVACVISATFAAPGVGVSSVAEALPQRLARQARDSLTTDLQLTAGEGLISQNGQWYLNYQTDGNLVGYPSGGGDAFWAAGAFASPSGRALMQTDGNLVLYDSNNAAYWSTGTNNQGRPPNYRLVMQDDRNIVIYDSINVAIWSSGTVQPSK